MNLDLAKNVLQSLASRGIHEIVLCSGARNSPFVWVLENSEGFRVYNFFEERAAAFFALGRIKNHMQPVAVLTTSGTAAAELFPAVIEAHYTGAPLVLITADRPRKLRGTGAPQTIDQVNLFGNHVDTFVDIAINESFGVDTWTGHGPLHVNVCFDEPLIDRQLGQSEFLSGEFRRDKLFRDDTLADHFITLKNFLSQKKCPVFLLGPLPLSEQKAVKDFLLRMRAPVFAESLSGLREDVDLAALTLKSGEGILNLTQFDCVVRIGGVPTVRFWRDLDGSHKYLPVLSINSVPFSGLSRGTFLHTDIKKLLTAYDEAPALDQTTIENILSHDQSLYRELQGILDRESRSEVALIHRLSMIVESGSNVYLGNSQPIREWDLAAYRDGGKNWEMNGNRGVNGIDGQLSTFFGFCNDEGPNWGVFGDLTTLYDLASPWAIHQKPLKNTRIVVINNSGGQIFSRIFKSQACLNTHNLNFGDWARMWNMGYEQWTGIPQRFSSEESTIIEVIPEADASQRFWKAYEELWKAPRA